MNILTIDKKEFQKGITIDNEDDDGGMSPDSYGLNYFLSKGLTLIPQPDFTGVTGNTDDEIVDGCSDPSILGDDCFFIDKDKNFYILDGATLTKKQTDTVRDYSYGTTRIITFKGEIFCTSSTDIAKLDVLMTALDGDWWTNTLSKTALSSLWRHPMEVVEDTLYIADGFKIHTWDGSAGVYNAMSIPTSYNITELRISNDGRHLIVFASETANYAHSKKSKSKAFYIDTVTLEFIREIEIADQVESAFNVRGTTYVIYGKSFGYLAENGLNFIRSLDISTPIYNARVNTNDDFIFIAEKKRVLVYGDVNGKGNIFFYVSKEASNNINHLIALGTSGIEDNKLAISFYDASETQWIIETLDFDTRGTNDIDVLTKKYRKGKVWIRRIEIETETLASGDSLTISTVNADGTYNEVGTFSYALNGAVQDGRIDCNVLTDFVQLRLQWANFAIKELKIYYESGE